MGLRVRTAHINFPLEMSAEFDGDASCRDVAGQRSAAMNLDAIDCREIAMHSTAHNHFTSLNIGQHNCIPSDAYVAVGRRDGAFHPAFDVEGFRTADLAFDNQGFANIGASIVIGPVRSGGCAALGL